MKNRWIFQIVGAFLVGGSILSCGIAQAEDTVLARTKIKYKGEPAVAQLWGERQKNGYANKLMVILKREDGSLITGYSPSINGGYGCCLEPVQVKKAKAETEQLLLTVQQGSWNTYSEFRILDMERPKDVKELFTGSDNFGVISDAKLENNVIVVKSTNDKGPVKVELEKKMVEDISDNRRQLAFSKISSLTPMDIDKNGTHELISTQQIIVDKRVLADVGAVWHYTGQNETIKETKNAVTEEAAATKKSSKKKSQGESLQELLTQLKDVVGDITRDSKAAEDKAKTATAKRWKHSNITIMKNDMPNKANSINNGKVFKGGIIYPVRMVAHNGEATYPQLILENNIEMTETLNKLLRKECEGYIQDYLKGKTDVAFNVSCADEKIFSLQIITGKNTFTRHNINILRGQKQKAELKDVLDIKAKGLVELLNTLNTNDKVSWDKNLTDEWYVRNGNIYLMKRIAGVDEVSGFALKNLQNYLKDKRFMTTKAKGK